MIKLVCSKVTKYMWMDFCQVTITECFSPQQISWND